MVTFVRPEQLLKAFSPIDVTLLGIIVFLHPKIIELVDVSIIALQLSRESYFLFPFSTDIQAIINAIVEGEYDEKADVNEDDVVNGTDIQEVINIIVNAD